MEIQLNRKILFRKAIRATYKNVHGRKPSLEQENKLLAEMIKREEENETEEATKEEVLN